jgi:hypothetical protein
VGRFCDPISVTTKATTKYYGSGSLKMYREIKDSISLVAKKIKDKDGRLPDEFEKQAEDFNASFGAYSVVWMEKGYIFKWTRCFRQPKDHLLRLIVPTVAITFRHERYVSFLIVQKKIFGSADFYKMRSKHEWAVRASCKRFYRWHNIVSWFARGTNWGVTRHHEDDYGAAPIFYSAGEEYLDVFFEDVHAENIGFDNGQLKVLDW